MAVSFLDSLSEGYTVKDATIYMSLLNESNINTDEAFQFLPTDEKVVCGIEAS